MSDFLLPGLHPQNLAAHLAFYGALRILEEEHPEWKPRGFWRPDETGWWSAVLRLSDEAKASDEDICGVLSEGLAQRGRSYKDALDALSKRVKANQKDGGEDAKPGKKKKSKKKETPNWTQARPVDFREAVRDLWGAKSAEDEFARQAELLCAVSAGLPNEKRLDFSPLFLVEGSIRPKLANPRGFGGWSGTKNIPEKDIPDKIHTALFGGDWPRSDDIFKWYWDWADWAEQARAGRDPADEKNAVEWAATALAVIGFCGLGAFAAAGRHDKVRTAAPGYSRGGRVLHLPLWNSPATFAAVRELLGWLPDVLPTPERIKQVKGRARQEREYLRLCYRLRRVGVAQVVKVEFFTGAQGRRNCARLGDFLEMPRPLI